MHSAHFQQKRSKRLHQLDNISCHRSYWKLRCPRLIMLNARSRVQVVNMWPQSHAIAATETRSFRERFKRLSTVTSEHQASFVLQVVVFSFYFLDSVSQLQSVELQRILCKIKFKRGSFLSSLQQHTHFSPNDAEI